MGGGFDPNLIHDYYSFPHTSGHGREMTPEEQSQLLALAPPLPIDTTDRTVRETVEEFERVVGPFPTDTDWHRLRKHNAG
jgi:hypothetical protein